jgi:hypothetical protein
MPIERNGQNIGDITLNGNAIGEVTVNGQTVFSAGPSLQDIIAPDNLLAWWPFENDGQDETASGALLDQNGITVADSSDYSVTGGNNFSYASSGGLTDLQTGQDSGRLEVNDGYADASVSFTTTSSWTGTMWINFGFGGNDYTEFFSCNGGDFISNGQYLIHEPPQEINAWKNNVTHPYSENSTVHVAFRRGGSDTLDLFVNGSIVDSNNGLGGTSLFTNFSMGGDGSGENGTGFMDDVRIYNTDLTNSQIEQIVLQTQDPNNTVLTPP